MSRRRFIRNQIPAAMTLILLMIIYVLFIMFEFQPLANEYVQSTVTYTKNITSLFDYYNDRINYTLDFSSLFTTKYFMTKKNDDDDDSYYTQWGEWSFRDVNDDIRPKYDYCSSYPNRDITHDAFPKNAWQTDEVYMTNFLTEAKQLLSRAKEAIFTEYGLGLPSSSQRHTFPWSTQLTPLERDRHRHTLSNLTLYDFDDDRVSPPRDRAPVNDAGWTTVKSYDGLVRRLLHAMMTNDNFTVVLGGHSSAAGHGNHFKQSYVMEFHRIMAPIFSRLGVTLITKNLAMGGLGTSQSSLGHRSIYGPTIDLLLWDSAMTEGSPPHVDLFARQALLSPSRPPFLFGGIPSHLHRLHTHTGADVGIFGDGTAFLPLTKNESQVEELPPLTRFLNCDANKQGLCTSGTNKYNTTCWIEREDVTPPISMRPRDCPGQESWHPGWRFHRLRGRVVSLTMLGALERAVATWSDETEVMGHPLADDVWHVTERYRIIREKTEALDWSPEEGYCESLGDGVVLPKKVCRVPMYGMTEYTPRNDPENTGIQSRLVKRFWKGEEFPNLLERFRGMLYEGEDVPIPSLGLPEGVIDVERIVSQRRRRRGLLDTTNDHDDDRRNDTIRSDHLPSSPHRSLLSSPPSSSHNATIVSGLGWDIDAMPGYCDGTYDAICGRRKDEICNLCGHHDHRGGIMGHSMSGWLIFNLPPLEEGVVIVTLKGFVVLTPRTVMWTKVNNGTDDDVSERRRRRRLATFINGRPATRIDKLCPEVAFDYAINGNVTTLNRTEIFDKLKIVSRVVEVMTLLDDERFVAGMTEEEKGREVEVAIRIRNCRTFNGFTLTHVYWA